MKVFWSALAALSILGLLLSGTLLLLQVRNDNRELRALTERQEPSVFPSGPYAFANELWFSRDGYTPHYAEHVIDPLDGREKLVMADPHTRCAAFIYDLASREIEWEVVVPGDKVNNPHTSRMLMRDVDGFGEAGDIYCVDRDQRVIVIDRQSGGVQRAWTLSAEDGQWDPGWLHDACLSVDTVPHLILSDYNGPDGYKYAKYRISDGGLAWHRGDFSHPGKITPIEGAHSSLHTPDYGGDYLICQNEFHGAVWEVRDSDGSWTWARPRDCVGPGLVSPHSAFRMGRTENCGWVTVVGTESGGGIMALHFIGAPIWAIGGGGFRSGDHSAPIYTASVSGLGEVTHVFPTLGGSIGFIDWNGVDRANVGIITRLPAQQHAGWQVAGNKSTTDEWAFNEYIPVGDWDETWITVRNRGSQPLSLYVEGCLVPNAAFGGSEGRLETWAKVADLGGSGSTEVVVAAGDAFEFKLHRPFYYIIPFVKSASAGNATFYDLYVDQKRG